MKNISRLLFISRAFPPILGGIENQNRGLAEALPEWIPTTCLINRYGKRALPWFLPWAALVLVLRARRYTYVLLGDGVLAPLGSLVKLIHRGSHVFSVVHGLDITFANRPGIASWIYRRINLPALRRLDGVIAVGRATAAAAAAAGITPDKIHFIPNGIFSGEFTAPPNRLALAKLLGIDLIDRHVVLIVGRYVERKGLTWFINHVLPGLPESVILVAVGAAPAITALGDPGYLAECKRAAAASGLAQRILLFTDMPQSDLVTCLGAADLVVMPNIAVPGTIEGFGLTALEAGAMGRTILAADLEGLRDAIADGKNGVLLPSGDAAAWQYAVRHWLGSSAARDEFGQRAAEYVHRHCSWRHIAQRYAKLLYSVAHSERGRTES